MKKREKLHAEGDLIMKAFIICDDVSLVANANATLQRVGGRPNVRVEWISQCWPVNALSHAALAKNALVEAADAHLIIIPARHAHSLWFSLRDWLEQWAELRLIHAAALAVINDGRGAGLPVSPELIHFVQKHSLNFIADEVVGAKNFVKVVRPSSPEREPWPAVEKSHFEYALVYEAYRGYGINE